MYSACYPARTSNQRSATPMKISGQRALITGIPLREVTTPEQFANAARFFASPWARAVTGQNLVVDGGLVRD
ncbi:SDR family oxidoreductase [Stenotrophomonas sp. MH1]|uniref:SDR family oxidoreductase n=2 Tax=Stenotrophomonas capsici TaxID=3110230 RepID=A0ABU5V0A3_9GAMM|nr:SDR family oxidoreductase [Stenotrophomonas sp. MH1]MEA5666768.1 SDR family oxidoreductase [Stenotrophomonas sp. MH1]